MYVGQMINGTTIGPLFALCAIFSDHFVSLCSQFNLKVDFYFRQLPDQIWVQCDNPACLKWRKLPEGTDPEKLPDKWYCKDNPYPHMRSCDIPEEKEEEMEQPYVKTQKKRL